MNAHDADKFFTDMQPQPQDLPLRYELPSDDEHTRWFVALLFDEIILEKVGAGGVYAKQVFPLDSFRGVALGLNTAGDNDYCYTINLIHTDLDLKMPLYNSRNEDQVIERWQNWSQTLMLPALVEEPDGTVSHPFTILANLVQGADRHERTTLYAQMRASGIWPVIAGDAAKDASPDA
jgi:hypothetical protein